MEEGEHYRFVAAVPAEVESSKARASRRSTAYARDWPDGWGLVRASNTDAWCLVLRFDADNDKAPAAGSRPRSAAQLLFALNPELELPF